MSFVVSIFTFQACSCSILTASCPFTTNQAEVATHHAYAANSAHLTIRLGDATGLQKAILKGRGM